MSHWDAAPYFAVCASKGCVWECEAITADTLDVALDGHTAGTGHHLYAVSATLEA